MSKIWGHIYPVKCQCLGMGPESSIAPTPGHHACLIIYRQDRAEKCSNWSMVLNAGSSKWQPFLVDLLFRKTKITTKLGVRLFFAKLVAS